MQSVLLKEPLTIIRWHFVTIIWICFVILTNVWVLYSELYTGASNIAGGNPPVPVLLALCLLILTNRWLKLSGSEILAFYILACFSILPLTYGGVRSFFPSLVASFYYAMPDNRLKEFWTLVPNWWAPKDSVIVRGFFEGMSGHIPWDAWILPLILWTFFFITLWAIGCGAIWMFTQQWLRAERLNFPLAQLPIQIVYGANNSGFFSIPIVWIGMAIGTLPTGLMMLTSLFRPVRRWWDLAPFFAERPFSALRPLMIFPLMEGVGFGYLVTQEVLFSTWFFYFILKLFSLISIGIFGWEIPSIMTIGDSFPFPHSQSVGGYLAIAFILLYRGWKNGIFKQSKPSLCLFAIGSVIAIVWMVVSGMAIPIAIIYYLVLTMFVITYGRIRAEAGMPYSWVYPYGAQRDFLHYTLGIGGLLRLGGLKSLVILSGLFWVARHFLLNLNGAYAADSAKISNEVAFPNGVMEFLAFAGAIFGLWAAFITHLKAYYRRGANFLEGAPGSADYRTYVAAQDYRLLSQMLGNPMPPDRWRMGFTVYGLVATATLAWLRRNFPSFPLHPIGFPLAYAYSHHCPYWFPTMFIWAIKGLILRYGGMGLYRKLIPLFLGISLGHYLMTGVIWGGILSPIFKDRWPYHFRVVFE
ncbi:MAG: DUF6785 family protein [Armatimonadota bacterium]|nr:hypothetical protein [Armatimonadota bacterium]MDW8025618.1 DUF6785 family protein [Armatimonadota bacterium]